jgi:hypothetical protein
LHSVAEVPMAADIPAASAQLPDFITDVPIWLSM